MREVGVEGLGGFLFRWSKGYVMVFQESDVCIEGMDLDMSIKRSGNWT